MERLKAMKEQLTSCVQSQLGNLSEVNAATNLAPKKK